MPDVFTKAKRSAVMSLIRSRGNKDTELALMRLFRCQKIIGWRRHYQIKIRNSDLKVFKVRPDFIFPKVRLAIFVDGCFWHSCPLHLRAPASNVDYWNRKLERNRVRDRKVNAELRSAGWTVVRIWEHAFAKPGGIVSRLKRALRTHREPVKGSPSATHATKPETKRP